MEVFVTGPRGFTKRCGTESSAGAFLRAEFKALARKLDGTESSNQQEASAPEYWQISDVEGGLVEELPEGTPGTIIQVEEGEEAQFYGFGQNKLLKAVSSDLDEVSVKLRPQGTTPGYR